MKLSNPVISFPLSKLRVVLRDIDHGLVQAWTHHFAGLPNVEVDEGDIFRRSADALVSPANSYGFMDGGIDMAYTRRFGWELSTLLQDVIHTEHDGELPVGQAVIVPTHDLDFPWLVSAPTMRVPMDVSATPNAYLAFRAALQAVRKHNASEDQPIRSLLCPGLGTAIGQMHPDVCARQMRAAYDAVALGLAPRFGRLWDAKNRHLQQVSEI